MPVSGRRACCSSSSSRPSASGPAPETTTARRDFQRKTLEDLQATLHGLDPTLQFVFLADVTAVDRLPAEPRYEVVYHLSSLGEAYTTPSASAVPPQRLRMKVRVPGGDPRLPTVTSVYPTAGWPEREVFDLFGLHFEGHPDLRRILMPEDWEGYPLRKDYPVQIRKDTPSWSPLQLSAEEFAENVRAQRELAKRDAEPGPASGEGSPRRD